MAAAGVLRLQITGGEPLIDPLFAETHARAYDLLTLSIYGATEASYDGMTRRKGSLKRFMRGLHAAHEAGLPMRMNIVVSNRNAH
jgi:MoaA/NifB/PqqE/SkfB family radical SAM enzyme